MTDVDFLKSFGGIVTSDPVRKTVKFKLKGKEYSFDIGVIEFSVDDHERLFLAASDESQTARLISQVVRLGDDLSQQLSLEDAKKLHPTVATAFMKAFNEVNGEGPEKN